MRGVTPYSPGQFALFRVIFGAYLTWHHAVLVGDAAELFSNQGVLADASLNPLAGLFPNPLVWWGTPAFATGFVVVLMGLSVLMMMGWRRRWVALLLWFGWAALFNRNNLISNPGVPYVGLLLAMLVIVPDGEPARWRGKQVAPGDWFMPSMVWRGVWFLVAVGYTFSGLVKLGSPSWVDGSAFVHLISNPLARPGPIRDLFLVMPVGAHHVMTWFALAGEILFLLLCFWRKGRLIAWALMMGMHLGILTMVAFADLTLGMLMVHVFIFDAAWVRPQEGPHESGKEPLLLYDGECGLCNAVVRFLLREDTKVWLRFAPLQSETGQATLRRLELPTEDFDSIVFLPDRTGAQFSQRTAGVIDVALRLGGVWRLIGMVGRCIPGRWRDLGYKLVARFRYAMFGEYTPSPLPDPRWGERVLD